jgi:hypothetical protein
MVWRPRRAPTSRRNPSPLPRPRLAGLLLPVNSTKRISTMRMARPGAMDFPTALALLAAAVCYAAWLTSIVFCAAHGSRSLLIAAASFFPVGIVHGAGIWFGVTESES